MANLEGRSPFQGPESVPMNSSTQVVIIGAGPYGLSLAAQLNRAGVPCRIFGQPMQTWREQMPAGMQLKSDGFASNLSDGRERVEGSFSLQQFCAEASMPYHHTHIRVPLERFVAYGREFQRRLVPQLETQNVTRVERVHTPTGDGFSVTLEDGETIATAYVVVAVGISRFEYLPPVFAGLPAEFVTHSSAHPDLSRFAGKQVTVVGAGASALEIVALLNDAGAQVTVVARVQELHFSKPPSDTRSLWQRLRHPMSEMGPGLRSWMAQHFPHVFRHLPKKLRLKIVKKHLGPSGGYFVKDRVVGRTTEILGASVEEARVENGAVKLVLSQNGQRREHVTEHVIAATGYQVNLNRLPFLPEELKKQIETVGGSPKLDRNFQSSVPGMFFVGAASASTFGPLMRFACGSKYTATWLARYFGNRKKTL